MMELQFTHRIEMMLAEERVCLERHKEELAIRQARVLYLESVTSEDACVSGADGLEEEIAFSTKMASLEEGE